MREERNNLAPNLGAPEEQTVIVVQTVVRNDTQADGLPTIRTCGYACSGGGKQSDEDVDIHHFRQDVEDRYVASSEVDQERRRSRAQRRVPGSSDELEREEWSRKSVSPDEAVEDTANSVVSAQGRERQRALRGRDETRGGEFA